MFFGTYSTLQGPGKETDKELGLAVDGSKMSKNTVDRIARFLATDRLDNDPYGRNETPNIFNDGVIRYDLLSSGIGEKLINAYFEAIADDLGDKFSQFVSFRPYSHPQASFLSAESYWAQYMPSINRDLKAFKAKESLDKDALKLLAKLYLDQTRFPSQYLRQMLWQSQNQMQWIRRDPEIEQGDLSLFRAHSIRDWFGSNFLQVAAQFIYNSSLIAEKKGYRVSLSEAKADLYKVGYETLKLQVKEEISPEKLSQAFQTQFQIIGMSEEHAVKVWQKVLLFRKMLTDVGGSTLIDQLSLASFHQYAGESIEADVYELPDAYALKSFRDLLLIETYLDATSARKGADRLLLPKEKLSVSAVEARAPELVYEKFRVEIAEVDQDMLSDLVGLKETWAWQTDSSNLKLLQKEFPELKKTGLEKLDDAFRLKVDQFTRAQIVKSHPKWLQEQLANASTEEKTIYLSLAEGSLPFVGKVDRKKLSARLKSESEITSISFDDKHTYRIKVLEKPEGKAILTLEEAKEQGTLDLLLDRKLQASHMQVRGKDAFAFQNDQAEWKPFEEVKDLVGKYVYADLLSQIQKSVSSKKEEKNLDFYVTHRFTQELKSKKNALTSGSSPDTLQLKKTEQVFERKNKSGKYAEELFQLDENSWSDVLYSSKTPYFAFVKRKFVNKDGLAEKMESGESLLGFEAKNIFAEKLIDQIVTAKAIHFEEK